MQMLTRSGVTVDVVVSEPMTVDLCLSRDRNYVGARLYPDETRAIAEAMKKAWLAGSQSQQGERQKTEIEQIDALTKQVELLKAEVVAAFAERDTARRQLAASEESAEELRRHVSELRRSVAGLGREKIELSRQIKVMGMADKSYAQLCNEEHESIKAAEARRLCGKIIRLTSKLADAVGEES